MGRALVGLSGEAARTRWEIHSGMRRTGRRNMVVVVAVSIYGYVFVGKTDNDDCDSDDCDDGL